VVLSKEKSHTLICRIEFNMENYASKRAMLR
jgi:hypothetical protein